VFVDLPVLTGLSTAQFYIVVGAVFVAGVVRGFSGFALSALVMASLAIMIAPIELIVVCWLLELSASLLMVRGGFKDGDIKVALGLAIDRSLQICCTDGDLDLGCAAIIAR